MRDFRKLKVWEKAHQFSFKGYAALIVQNRMLKADS